MESKYSATRNTFWNMHLNVLAPATGVLSFSRLHKSSQSVLTDRKLLAFILRFEVNSQNPIV